MAEQDVEEGFLFLGTGPQYSAQTAAYLSTSLSKPVTHVLKTESDLFLRIPGDISFVSEEAHDQLRVLVPEANRRFDSSCGRK